MGVGGSAIVRVEGACQREGTYCAWGTALLLATQVGGLMQWRSPDRLGEVAMQASCAGKNEQWAWVAVGSLGQPAWLELD